MTEWKSKARTLGIWVSGLIAGGLLGGMIGSGITYAYQNEEAAGAFGGMFAFICLRLWLGSTKGAA